ncbi:hypothetical protein CMQ_3935 [Grosmannia clavigera kw1407]|uniref:Uncharacterized protein n=1 Tax=Grosmannia clavigera (strain kw1407 / UAMH 11150) TaxID=655863 RepID=F0X986_GROCL|nr:uncharacterized protein CMQ_3935 [Grosmannia clavigera kw1407]EFX05866.1 hypothetical protein CMQ_3935 [Grosmannia clavigera kw1407]
MAEPASESRADAEAPKAAKDRNCPYCGQAFTSSSLGRHLDLYIKERNPKKPDGLHDVEEIRKLRGNVTRRQMKASLGRRHTSTPAGTPNALSKKGSISDIDSSAAPSPAAAKDARSPDPASVYPLAARWEATGVINEVMARSPDDSGRNEDSRSHGDADLRLSGFQTRPMVPAMARPGTKAEWDMKQKMQDAMDTARAAKLALRELLGTWRSAKLQIDLGSSPFDFDPLSMNFPALTLQCLRPAPTLFASTLHPTSSSWSTTPPGSSQYEALKAFFKEEFRKWKVKCAAATTAVFEELKYPPAASLQKQDRAEAVERAEQRAETLEREAEEHLEATFAAWAGLPPERQTELWVLELARGVATKQTELDKMAHVQHRLNQEVTNLKSQIEQLNRLQQPREYKIVPPMTIPMSEKLLMMLQDEAVTHSCRKIGWDIGDRNADLDVLLSVAVDRWKSVVVSARSANRTLAAAGRGQMPAVAGGGSTLAPPPPTSNRSVTPSLGSPQQAWLQQQQPLPRPGVPMMIPQAAATAPTALMESASRQPQKEVERKQGTQQRQQHRQLVPPAQQMPAVQPVEAAAQGAAQQQLTPQIADVANDEVSDDDEDDEMSDKDADAEMEDGDEFAHMHTPISRSIPPSSTAPPPLMQQQLLPTPPIEHGQQIMPQLKVPRARGPVQQPLSMVANTSIGLGDVQSSTGRSVAAVHVHSPGHHVMHQADMGLTMATLGADSMFMD